MSKLKPNNKGFIDNVILSSLTYDDYLDRLSNIVLNLYDWINLPTSMNSIFLERSLMMFGQATLLFDESYGYINTNCSSGGYLNIYNIPTSFNCYSNQYQSFRNTYQGFNEEDDTTDKCILVMNNWNRTPIISTIKLFAYRLFHAEQTAFINILAQRTPVLILTSDKQRLTLENIYSQYDGYTPVIYGDKEQLGENIIRSLKTDAPFIADKIMEYKKEIWNEFLTYMGINSIPVEKRERLVKDEVNSNNELTNINLYSRLKPRKVACEQFNTYFKIPKDKQIDVKVNSDIWNLLKTTESVFFNKGKKKLQEKIEELGIEEVIENG